MRDIHLSVWVAVSLLGGVAGGCSGGSDCEPGAGTACLEGTLYQVDSCGQPEEVLEQCECGCNEDETACEDNCGCVPSCEGKQCGSDGCGDNDNCGTCDEGWECVQGVCVVPETCNNGQLETYEECEGFELRGQTCQTRGFDAGTLSCNDDCTLNTSQCRLCGNDMAEPGEVCDGTDLGQLSCASAGYVGGTLQCLPGCMDLDFSDCHDCGNDTVDTGEACDGTDLDGETCESLGFTGGTLACNEDCKSLDHAGCTGSPCDDSGNCDECKNCALNTLCTNEAEACIHADGSGCISYFNCIDLCSEDDQACLDQCAAEYPEGKASWEALQTCLVCVGCFNDCDGANAGCP